MQTSDIGKVNASIVVSSEYCIVGSTFSVLRTIMEPVIIIPRNNTHTDVSDLVTGYGEGPEEAYRW